MNTNYNDAFIGESGYVEEGLSHLAIPKGWSWGGQASSYGPLWCTFYNSSTSDGNVEKL